MDMIKALVFPCGSEIGLEIHEALKNIRFVEVHGASSVRDHGAFVYRNYHEGLPYLTDPRFKKELVKLIEELGIDVVFPALDSAVLELSRIADDLPCKVIASSYETAQICRSKELTYQVFHDCWFNPRSYASNKEVDSYPVIIKPSVGQGSQGFKIIESEDELVFELKDRADKQVICEYLPGEEYTIDCFTDRHGSLRYASQRVRHRTKAGISVNSYLTKPDDLVWGIAELINLRMSMRGVWFFQLKRNGSGEYRLLEIAPRVAGTMCLERAIGVNLPLLSIFDALDYDVDILPQFAECEVDRSFYNVFSVSCDYEHVYLDFDDTLVCDGKVNIDVVSFVYQCVNKGIPITLLTRHTKNIKDSLAAAKISEDIFQRIVVLDDDQKKSSFIEGDKVLFVDDSFAERKEVAQNTNAIVLGLESLDVVMDRKA